MAASEVLGFLRLVGLIIVVAAVVVYFNGGLPEAAIWKNWGEAAYHWAAALGILAAAYWFLVRRETFPRAVLDVRVFDHPLTARLLLVTAIARIKNVGQRTFVAKSAVGRIQQIVPLTAPIDHFHQENGEIHWLQLDDDRRVDLKDCHIEPGEDDEIVFDFTIDRCVQVVRIYIHINNATIGARSVGWSWTGNYRIS